MFAICLSWITNFILEKVFHVYLVNILENICRTLFPEFIQEFFAKEYTVKKAYKMCLNHCRDIY